MILPGTHGTGELGDDLMMTGSCDRASPGVAHMAPAHSGGLLSNPPGTGRGCFPPLESGDWEEPSDLQTNNDYILKHSKTMKCSVVTLYSAYYKIVVEEK